MDASEETRVRLEKAVVKRIVSACPEKFRVNNEKQEFDSIWCFGLPRMPVSNDLDEEVKYAWEITGIVLREIRENLPNNNCIGDIKLYCNGIRIAFSPHPRPATAEEIEAQRQSAANYTPGERGCYPDITVERARELVEECKKQKKTKLEEESVEEYVRLVKGIEEAAKKGDVCLIWHTVCADWIPILAGKLQENGFDVNVDKKEHELYISWKRTYER